MHRLKGMTLRIRTILLHPRTAVIAQYALILCYTLLALGVFEPVFSFPGGYRTAGFFTAFIMMSLYFFYIQRFLHMPNSNYMLMGLAALFYAAHLLFAGGLGVRYAWLILRGSYAAGILSVLFLACFCGERIKGHMNRAENALYAVIRWAFILPLCALLPEPLFSALYSVIGFIVMSVGLLWCVYAQLVLMIRARVKYSGYQIIGIAAIAITAAVRIAFYGFPFAPVDMLTGIWVFSVVQLIICRSERRDAYHELEMLSANLESKVDERMQELLDLNRDMLREILARERAEQELKLMTVTDNLTQVYNRVYAQQIFDSEVEKTRRYGTPFSVVMFDIDHFKNVNDTCGHEVGDHVLTKIAGTLKGLLRGSDILARWGGEEFLILLPNTAFEMAMQTAERLRARLEKLEHEKVGRVTASFGVTEVSATDDSRAVSRRVDKYLYKAKHNGRNRVEGGG